MNMNIICLTFISSHSLIFLYTNTSLILCFKYSQLIISPLVCKVMLLKVKEAKKNIAKCSLLN